MNLDNSNFTKIDIHAHILPPKWPSFNQNFGYNGWIELKQLDQIDNNGNTAVMMHDDGRVFRPVVESLYSIEHRLKDMDRTGVNRQVLSTVPVMFNYWAKAEDNEVVARFLNDHIAEVVRNNNDRFIGLATVPMQNAQLAVNELIRCRYELGMKGAIIGTHVNDRSFDDPMFEPLWKAAEEHSMPLLIHPWDVCKANGRWNKFWLPHIVGMTAETTACALTMAISGVLEKHRNLKLCFSHGGGSLPYLSARANHGFLVYPNDMQKHVTNPPDFYLRKSPNICADALVHDSNALKLALDYYGEDSLMLGSDYPFLLGEHRPGELIEKCGHFLNNSSMKKLLSENALRFFNSE